MSCCTLTSQHPLHTTSLVSSSVTRIPHLNKLRFYRGDSAPLQFEDHRRELPLGSCGLTGRAAQCLQRRVSHQRIAAVLEVDSLP
jgi:hypothetical protein